MAFNQKELEIIKFGTENGKSRQEVEQALSNYRSGIIPQAKPTETTPTASRYEIAMGIKNPDGTPKETKGIIPETIDQFKRGFQQTQEGIKDENLGGALNKIGQGALNEASAGLRLAFSPIEVGFKVVSQLPGISNILGGVDKGVNYLADKISNNKELQDFTQKNPNAAEVVGNLLNVGLAVALGKVGKPNGVPATEIGSIIDKTVNEAITKASNIPETISNVATKAKESLQPIVDKTVETSKNVLKGRDEKLLSIFSGEDTAVVRNAIENPSIADQGIVNGDVALRRAVETGGESSIKARQSFTQAYRDAFNTLVKDNPSKITSKQKVLYQFTDDLVNQGVKIKNGKLDFSTSKIVANPGEITKINNAYEAIKNWTDFSLKGTNELKQLVGQLTKFATEAGGSSKSPFLGKFYNYLDTEIKGGLPEQSRAAYEAMNKKFSENIGLYNEMVDAFNSGDPFTKLAQLFSKNKDSLRQIVDFYEQTTGNKIAPIVAGRTLAMEKQVAFGFLNPRSWVDFFIPPEAQAKIVTSYGRLKNSAKSEPISTGTKTPETQSKPKSNKTIISPKSTTKSLKVKGEIPETNLINEAKKYKSAEEFVTNTTELTYKNLQENPYSIKAYGKDFNEPVEYYRAGAIRKNGDIWLTDNQAGAQQYSSAGGGTKVGSYIIESKKPLIIDAAGGKYANGNIDINKILTKEEITQGYTNNPAIKQKFIDYAKKNGYDSVQFADSFPDGEGGMRSLVVWDKGIIKTKSQLEEIWKKANKK